MILPRYSVLVISLALTVFACNTDSDCNYNGVCNTGTCTCYAGWTADDCGMLDLKPVWYQPSGYNLTGQGTSSWGGKIIQDPLNKDLFHLFVAEITDGCGLNSWSPYSRIVRAVSQNGILGPYEFAAEIVGAFAHNPTVVWSPVDNLYLLYYIGCGQSPLSNCQNPANFQCGPGNNI
jgi:hypothetical protein